MNKQTFDINIGFDKISKLVSSGYVSEYGPGDFPVRSRRKKIFGVIAPNYTYDVCAGSAAWAYKEIAESEIPEEYIILGSGGQKFSTFLLSDWESSLGTIRINRDYGRLLIRGSLKLQNNVADFENNYSIDIQLPFLQFANIKNLEKTKFIPILVGSVTYEEICEFADMITEIDRDIAVICSSNLSYYGKNYGYVPFLHAIKENIYQIDRKALDFICNMDVKGFLEFTKKRNFLERNVVALHLEIMKGLGCKKGILLNYHSSGDIEGYEKAVGFGTVVFR